MKSIFFALIALMLSGCISQKRCLQRFPPVTEETVKIVTETKIITRDTTILVRLPAEVLIQNDTVLIDNTTGLIFSEPSFLETSLAWSKAQVLNSKLHHELHQKDTTIAFRLNNAIKEIERLETELRQKQTTVEVPRPLSKWQSFLQFLGYLSLAVIFLLLLFLLQKLLPKP